jgi:uncharacterized protein YdbL (DUF1318 family)
LTALLGASAHAAIGDATIDGAITKQQIGEQADGYLGTVDGASLAQDVRARLDQINIRRRAAYTDVAEQRSVTVNEVAAATACKLIPKNTPAGAKYRDAFGTWRVNNGALQLPDHCGKDG